MTYSSDRPDGRCFHIDLPQDVRNVRDLNGGVIGQTEAYSFAISMIPDGSLDGLRFGLTQAYAVLRSEFSCSESDVHGDTYDGCRFAVVCKQPHRTAEVKYLLRMNHGSVSAIFSAMPDKDLAALFESDIEHMLSTIVISQ